MKDALELKSLSDDELLGNLSMIVQRSRRIESDLVAHVGEVDRRGLFAREATPSMFAYCTDVLHLAEHKAYRCIAAARASRKYPVLLAMLRDGRLHLSGIVRLAPQLDALDDAGREQLLRSATHGSKRHIEKLVAELNPKPDVPTTIRKLPQRPVGAPSGPAKELVPGRVGAVQAAPTAELSGAGPSSPEPSRPAEPPMQPEAVQPDRPARQVESVAVEPLAPTRYKVTFTASAELRDKLDRLRALMPDRDLAAIVEQAVTEKLERVEARRFGQTKTPRKGLDGSDTSSGSRSIPAPVKRVVAERDGEQCSFVNAAGRRCRSRHGLEYHHDEPFALGGDRSPENIRLLCRAHNRYLAESTYGADVMERYRRANVVGSVGSGARQPTLSG